MYMWHEDERTLDTGGEQIKKDKEMNRWWATALILLMVCTCNAQQIVYSNLRELLDGTGDTLTTLQAVKRNKSQILLMNGGDYRIECLDNPGLNRYLRMRCYAVRIDSALYVNCRKMRYKRYRFGGCFAPAWQQGNRIYFTAQPLGQAAGSQFTPLDEPRLGGQVGDALAASALIDVRVCYEIDPRTGRSHFVGKERLTELLDGYPALQDSLNKETNESAEVVCRYLHAMSLGAMQHFVYEGILRPTKQVASMRCRLEISGFEFSGDGTFVLTALPETGSNRKAQMWAGRLYTERGDAHDTDATVWCLVTSDEKVLCRFLYIDTHTLLLLDEHSCRPASKEGRTLHLEY